MALKPTTWFHQIFRDKKRFNNFAWKLSNFSNLCVIFDRRRLYYLERKRTVLLLIKDLNTWLGCVTPVATDKKQIFAIRCRTIFVRLQY